MGEVAEIRKALRSRADPPRAALLQRFFKTGAGEYGEGDRFLGLTVPQVRSLLRRFHPADFGHLPQLLRSPWHEERLLGLLLLVERYRKGSAAERGAAFRLYVRSFPRINNWDLVDASAEHVVGPHGVGRAQLLAWAASRNLWVRRIAIVSTFHSIRRKRFGDTLAVARRLLRDGEDLIHKATGWMLREVGKRDVAALESFLRRHHGVMPRTMLRYAIERFPEPRRKAWLAGRG
ncbi:MAG: DNA alkylation repair protein [Planctomycetes bacterium]|nr:DNA alkylation repair protein [Planctomycetota bacterium]